jgi:hypothetical protein
MGFVSTWIPCHWNAHQSESPSRVCLYIWNATYRTQAAADRIVREMELFGPDFEGYDQASQDAAPSDTADPKAKQVAPARPTYQFQIMESIGGPSP